MYALIIVIFSMKKIQMRNFFQYFLVILIMTIITGCSKEAKVNPIISQCAQVAAYAENNLNLNNFERNKFNELLKTRFVKYKELFKEAGELTGLEWEFLAAISFQESQWDYRAKSNMGVRGLMMLTQQTAKSLGISNRIDPRNSVIGGSRHLADIFKSIDYAMTESDKINFALATYNLGATNINNARAKLNTGSSLIGWDDLKAELILIDGEALYFKAQDGYSRGQQAIDFVERTREYAVLMNLASCQDSINQLTSASGI